MSQAGIINIAGGGGAGSPIQTLTGNSGGAVPPTANNISLVGAGSITVTGNPGTSTLTITDSGAGFTWNTVAGATQTVAANNGYINANAGLTTYTLPAVAAVGDTFQLAGYGVGGWILAQNAGQSIYLGNSTTTIGVGGSLASTNRHDTIEIMCIVANNEWQALDVIGIITVV